MFKNIAFCVSVAAASWSSSGLGSTSFNGSNIPNLSSITDSNGSIWTVNSSKVILKNGSVVGGNSKTAMLLYLNQNFYQLTTSGYWYEWSGVVWNKVTDPRVTNGNIGYVPAPATDIGPAIVDSGKNVWFLASNEVLYVNGKEAGSNYNTNYVFYFNGNIYCANTSSEWYQWKGSSWTRIAGNPT